MDNLMCLIGTRIINRMQNAQFRRKMMDDEELVKMFFCDLTILQV